MNRWERAWFRVFIDRSRAPRPSRIIPAYWFIAAPIRLLAWYLTTRK